MVTTEFKNKINAIWQAFYDGGMSLPQTIVDQLCVLMFIKMLDDKQSKTESKAYQLGIEPKQDQLTFKKGDWENSDTKVKIPYEYLRWKNFKNLNPKDLSNSIKNYCYPFIKQLNKDSDDVFSNFLTDVTYAFDGKEDVLVKVVDILSTLDFTDNDVMGDFFEHLIDGRLNGQFRTPRHIIDIMVNMTKPRLKERIIDPAMGTAGFLIESAKYIKEHQREELLNKSNRQFFSEAEFSGVDTEPTMTRIGCMNLLFHDVAKPTLGIQSLLIEQNNADYIGKYDVVLANPPFSGSLDKDLTDSRLLAVTKTSKTELLFVALFTKLLKIGGRCASIVPDGVLQSTSNAHKALRQELIDNQHLIAIVSMPSGVFQPYSGVKTSFLLFEKTNNGGTDKVWFYEMHGDGYTLDAKRDRDEKNDDCQDVINRFDNLAAEESRTRYDQSFLVPVQEIIDNDYDLSFNKYKKVKREVKTYRSSTEIIQDIESTAEQINKDLVELKKMLKGE